MNEDDFVTEAGVSAFVEKFLEQVRVDADERAGVSPVVIFFARFDPLTREALSTPTTFIFTDDLGNLDIQKPMHRAMFTHATRQMASRTRAIGLVMATEANLAPVITSREHLAEVLRDARAGRNVTPVVQVTVEHALWKGPRFFIARYEQRDGRRVLGPFERVPDTTFVAGAIQGLIPASNPRLN